MSNITRKIFINGVDYTKNLIDGYTITETKTEELNEATISLFNVDKLNIEPYDNVIITHGDKNYYFCINTWQEEIISYANKKYRYNITLISETKKLETVILPNLAITSVLGATKSYYVYINDVILPYIKKQFPNITLSNDFKDNLSEKYAPETTWSTPTAKQVLNDLLSTIPNHPSLVYIENNVIKYMDLSIKSNEIDLTKGIVNDLGFQQMSDYANKLVCNITNVIPKTIPNYKQVPSGFRQTDTSMLTWDSNLILEFPNTKIEAIKSCKILCNCAIKFWRYQQQTILQIYQLDIDIGPYILAKEQYDTLKVGGEGNGYKLYNLYFELDKSYIGGFGYTEKEIIGTSDYAFEYVLQRAYNDQYGSDYNPDPTHYGDYIASLSSIDIDLATTIFRAKFLTAGQLVQTFLKPNAKKYDVAIQDNQNQQYIDLISYSQSEREKVNRLGNEVKVLNATYTNYDNIPNLGDYTNNFILAKKEVAYCENQAICNLYLSKNFIQKNVYYGINSRRRYTLISAANNSVIRNEKMHFKVIFSKTEETGFYGTTANYFARYFGKPTKIVDDYADTKNNMGISPTCCKIISYNITGNTIAQGYVQPIVWTSGDSTILSLQTYDNFSLGMQVQKVNNKYLQQYVKYVDYYGEAYRFVYSVMAGYADDFNMLGTNDYTKNATMLYPEYSDTYPIGKKEILTFSPSFRRKDNRESIKLDIQFDFVSDDKDIIVSSNIGSLNSLLSENDEIVIIYSVNKEQKYDYIDEYTQPISEYTRSNVEVGKEYPHLYVPDDYINGINTKFFTSWCCYNNTKQQIIFACNTPENGYLPKEIWINVKEIL